MKKLKILIGCSGAGKSFWSHEQWEKDPLNTIIVSRDNIRYMFGYTEETIKDYYSHPDLNKLEKQITLYEDKLIETALSMGKTVIVDATHLRKEYLDRFKVFNVKTEFVVFYEDLDVLLERNKNRVRQVPENIIKKQVQQLRSLSVPMFIEPVEFDNSPKNKGVCYIVDIDNTVAEKGDRNAFDWKRVGEDKEKPEVVQTVLDLYSANNEIIFCSGRDEVCRKETEEWLYKTFIGMDFKLYMRPQGDMRPDWIVKEEMWREISKDYYIVSLIDDRDQVVRRARALGLTVIQVDYGSF